MIVTPAAHRIIESRFRLLLHDKVWLCWKNIRRGERVIKLPINPATGKVASVREPQSWSNYPGARARGRTHGLGLVLGVPLPGAFVIGIDIDTCRDPATGVVVPWASEVLGIVRSYAEVSPSGTGLKIFARMNEKEWLAARELFGANGDTTRLGGAWKSEGRHHPAGVEIYLGARYFTVTGLACNEEPINEIAAEDLRRLASFCARCFARSHPSRRPSHVQRRTGRDVSESGQAFNACLAAIRAGIAQEDVLRWVADQARNDGAAAYDISESYWHRRRREGTQLDRDYARALVLVRQQAQNKPQTASK